MNTLDQDLNRLGELWPDGRHILHPAVAATTGNFIADPSLSEILDELEREGWTTIEFYSSPYGRVYITIEKGGKGVCRREFDLLGSRLHAAVLALIQVKEAKE